MFDVRDFVFSMVEDKETNDVRFVIDCKVKDEDDTIFLDSQSAWIEHVKNKVASGYTLDKVIEEFFTGWWKEAIVEGIIGEWLKQGYSVDEHSFASAGTHFSSALKSLAKGAVRPEDKPIKPEPEPNV